MIIWLKRTATLATLLLAFGATALGQGASATPTHRVRLVHYIGDLSPFLTLSARDYDASIGFEARPEGMRTPLAVKLYDANLQDMLDAVIQSKPLYRWRERDGATTSNRQLMLSSS